MSIFQADLILFSAFKAALADMRRNEFLLEDAYSCVRKDPYLTKLYGEKEVERFKAFIRKEIMLFVEHRVPDSAKFPCIVIKLGSGSEDTPKDSMGDGYQSELVDPATLGGAFPSSHIVLGPITPVLYDSLTGQMTFGDDVDLSASHIFDSHFVMDTINNVAYPIELVLDSNNLLIEPGSKPNLTNMQIQTNKLSYGNIRRSFFVWENHEFDLVSTDANEVLYLFTIVIYILQRYKKQLFDARGYAAQTISYTPIFRTSQENDPNNLYGRTISIRGRVEHSVIESTQPLLQGFELDLRIADMSTPTPFLDQVEKSDWKGEEDP